MTPPSGDTRVCLGVIVGAKGLKGEVRIKPFTEEPAGVAAYGPVETEDRSRRFALTAVGEAKGTLVARIKGVTDRGGAEALKGLKLYVERGALPETDEGTYYHADLIGLEAVMEDGGAAGKVSAFFNFGGGDVMEITEADGNAVLVPFTEDAIAGVDIKAGRVTLKPMAGLFGESGDGAADGEDEMQG